MFNRFLTKVKGNSMEKEQCVFFFFFQITIEKLGFHMQNNKPDIFYTERLTQNTLYK